MLELAGAEGRAPARRGRDGSHLEAIGAVRLDDVDALVGNSATHLASVGKEGNADDKNREDVGANNTADLGGQIGFVAESVFSDRGGIFVEVDVKESRSGKDVLGEKGCSDGG